MANVKKLYFPHEHYARNDPKLQELLMSQGVAGIGVYWCIVEMLYEQGGYMPLKSLKSISFALHVDSKDINDIVMNYDLFSHDEDRFWSNVVIRHITEMQAVSQRNRKAANKRWNSNADAMQVHSKCNADAMQVHSKCNADAMQVQCYKNKNKNKNKNVVYNNNNSAVVVAAGLIDELKSDETWKETMMMRHHLTNEILLRYIDDFALDLQCRGTEAEHTTLTDIKNHINNWIRIQQENERKKEQQRTKENRRGYADVTARTAADYEEDS